jgi:hypothetical protein
MVYTLVLSSVILALIKIEDVFNFSEQQSKPLQFFLRRDEVTIHRASNLVKVYKFTGIFSAGLFLVCGFLLFADFLAAPLLKLPITFEMSAAQFPPEIIAVMILLLCIALLVLLLKIEAIWTSTVIETYGWDYHSAEAIRLKERVENRTNALVGVIAICFILVPVALIVLLLRLAGVLG